MVSKVGESDSQRRTGGQIPGAPASPAFTITAAEPSAIPVLVAVPHAGRVYPSGLLREMRHPESVSLRLEDRYVDRLGEEIAARTGASLLIAHAPRAMVDLNRAPDDIDWEMFERSARPERGGDMPSRRVLSGLGLIPRRLPGLGELWRSRHARQDLTARVDGIHAPYHEALAEQLAILRERWGAALLLDLHSMPPLPSRFGVTGAQYVVGDRFGVTCHGSVIATAFAHFAEQGLPSAHNRPYAGGYVLERHAQPQRGLHAFQLEIDRSCYLDAHLAEPGEGLPRVVDVLVGLIRRLAAVVADLGQAAGGRDWPLAAE
ncbi:N-formylglutamate amidohydrolase [Novosphingobium pentaromativorans]|uniref:N-formylglutamate amidohydrolase n=1 Tax=Novosphingobium pentaromativorans TaxID=205844 RepID=UPI000690E052|nr:N-formylglutamate amidohydrolase [Novosphingobium pentaromativorans]